MRKFLIGLGVVVFVVVAGVVVYMGVDRDSKTPLETELGGYEGLLDEVRRDMEFRESVETDAYGDLVDDGSSEQYKYAKFVYDVDSNIDEEVKLFLGDKYALYESALEKIRLECSAVMRNIPEGRDGYNPLSSRTIGVAYTDSCMLETGLEGYENFFIENALTTIDFFDDTCVVYAYNYPENKNNELVVVDYKNILVNTEYSTSVMELGDVRSVSGFRENSVIRKVGDFYVLYLKG